jgi:membrane protease subunit (stomatin/prohibitin family)
MAILDVIEFLDPTGNEIVHRVPEDDSGEFRLGSQLIVRESQAAVFFRDGKALDTFGAGRHTLSTNNIPILAGLLSLPFGGRSPFRAEVVFVSLQEFIDQKWGTPEPIVFRDSELGMVRLRAFGGYSMAVNNPQLFVSKIVGTQGMLSTDQISSFLRGVIISGLNDLLGENMKTVLDLPSMYEEIAAATRARVKETFGSMGLDLRLFNIQAITPPEDVQKAIDQRAGMGAIGMQNMQSYMQYQAAQAMRDAAQNEGAGGGAAAAGLGLGAGASLGAAMAGSLGQAAQQPAAAPPAPAAPAPAAPAPATVRCPTCNAENSASAKFCSECGARLSTVTKCPNCNADLAPGAKFCSECGAKIGA